MAERRAVAVVSGGLDSTTMAYWLRARGYDVTAISFDYGQRHRKELAFAELMAADLDASWTLIDLHAAGLTSILGGSALTDETVTVPDGHYADESMRITVVPNRNAIMLSIACALAVTRDAGAVAFGAHTGDHFIYPDCRPEFVRAFETMVNVAVAGLAKIEMLAPFLAMTKTDIVKLGDELHVPFERTWSCYKGGALHCGTCGTCFERREAFALAQVADPTRYEGVSAPAQ
ncbi:MAG TPA: 7-cyano-7-deazaguanine synthase QueC [Candidatus Saccharimonadales bacterium]|nr:7-cyano-7-deazaguanine synthase QueC [Candidatus Saccharimonadales bacterium]